MAVLSVLVLAAGCSQLAYKERELLFRIEPGNPSWFAGIPEGIRDVEIPLPGRSDGAHVHAWWWPAAKAHAPTVLYLHGVRWNLNGNLFRIQQLHDLGFAVLAIDYRGFGRSPGELPSEETVYEDARAAWQHFVSLQPAREQRYIYGHSLGGAVAVDLAHQLARDAKRNQQAVPAAGLIVESSFTNLADAADAVADTVWPVRWLLTQRFDSVDKIGDVGMPVLIVHGTQDRYMPPRMSERLFEAAREPKRLLLVEGGTHNNSLRVGVQAYRQALQELFSIL